MGNTLDMKSQMLFIIQIVHPSIICITLNVQVFDIRFDIEKRCAVEHIQSGCMDLTPFDLFDPDNADPYRVGPNGGSACEHTYINAPSPWRGDDQGSDLFRPMDVIHHINIPKSGKAFKSIDKFRFQNNSEFTLILFKWLIGCTFSIWCPYCSNGPYLDRRSCQINTSLRNGPNCSYCLQTSYRISGSYGFLKFDLIFDILSSL